MITFEAQRLLNAKAAREASVRALRKFEGCGVTFPVGSRLVAVAAPQKRLARNWRRRPRTGKYRRAVLAWLDSAKSGDLCSYKSLGLPQNAKHAMDRLVNEGKLILQVKSKRGLGRQCSVYRKP